MEFDFEAALTTGKDLTKALNALCDMLSKSPTSRTIPGSAAVANQTATVIFGTPSIGRIWNLLGISLTGNDDHTSDGSQLAIYIGNPSTFGLTDVLQANTGGKIPYSAFWNKDQVFVNHGEYVFAVIGGLATQTMVNGNIRILDYPRDNRWGKL